MKPPQPRLGIADDKYWRGDGRIWQVFARLAAEAGPKETLASEETYP
jgi:hypothetical protein